jgi:hypothetical protein
MILLLAVITGWLVGWTLSQIRGNPYRLPELSGVWIVLVAILPQLLVFHIPATARWFADPWSPPVLVFSQTTLLAFVWVNRNQQGFWLLGAGLILNLVVILANGGLMPLSPETASVIFPEIAPSDWELGTRLGRSKNIILDPQDSLLSGLSDWILLPAWLPWRRAVSPGDVLISLGVVWFLIQGGLFHDHTPESDTSN